MGEYSRNTIKGHGLKAGDVFDFYGYDDAPTAQADRVVITKEGNLYVLTVTDGKFTGERVGKLGAAKKIWAAKVDTVTVAPVAQGQTVHNLETDEVFTVTEVTPATVSLRKIGTWRDGVTLPARDVADMISSGTMVIIGNPGDVRAEADLVTSHEFSGHSRRPMECRLCSRAAEIHAATTDEGSSRAMWTKARKEAGMSTDAPAPVKVATVEPCAYDTVTEGVATNRGVEWTMLDSNIVTVVARLNYFGRISAGSEAVFLEVPEEWVTLARRAGVIIEHDEWVTVANNVVELLTEADKVDAFLYFNPRHGHASEAMINAAAKVKAYTGDPVPATVEDICPVCDFGQAGTVHTTPLGHLCAGNPIPWRQAESDIWAGTGTLIKLPIRTGLNRRKRKATKRNRARVGGGF